MNHPRAGQLAQAEDLVDVGRLVDAYYDLTPDATNPDEQVVFGTSGHRGSSLDTAFNEAHILATTQAICEYRSSAGVDGPLLIGRDTHALSMPAWKSALEVLVANRVTVLIDDRDGYTPTPAVSHAILRLNRDGSISDDNPFLTQTTGKYRAIYARGVRTASVSPRNPGPMADACSSPTWAAAPSRK